MVPAVKKNVKLPLFVKFVVIMILLSAGPLAFVGLRTININREALQTSILELHTQLAKSFRDKINDHLGVISNEVSYITNVLTTEDIPWPTQETLLKTMLDSHENIVSISLLDKTGYEKIKVYNPLLEKQPKLLNLKDNEIFQSLISSNQQRVLGPLYFVENSPRLNLFYRLSNKLTIFITLSLQTLWDELDKIRFGKTGHAFIVDNNGLIIAHKSKDRLLTPAIDIPIVKEAIKSVTIGSREYTDKTGENIVGSYAPIKSLNCAVIVQQPKNEAYYSSIIIQRQAISLIIASIILSSLAAFLIARNLSRPILALASFAKRIAQRDFSGRLNIKTHDELNDLIMTFNDMSAELKKYDDMQIDKIIAEKTKTEAIIFSIGEGIVMTNHRGEILLINHQARNMLGIEQTGLEGQYLWNYLQEQKLKDTLEEIIREKDSVSDEPIIKEIDLSGDNYTKFYQANKKPVTTPKGEKIGAMMVLRDITLEKEIDRMKEDFLHSITHDLRNPITSIRGFLKFMIDGIGGELNQQQKKMVETMDRASVRLMGMINDILDIAKLESQKMELSFEDVNLVDITKSIFELFEPQITKRVINTKIEIAGGSETVPSIRSDSKLIERVIGNLVGNALKFTPEQGTITVRIEDKTDRIDYSVTDTGYGIPPEYLNIVFDKFQQVTGQRRGGTGLGLTICKHVIEAHKGKIWVESKVGHGAKFTFYIPKNL